MKIEDDKVEPVTDLGLSLDYCSRYDQRISNDDPGAGANAGSSVHMAFVSANPLTELVWCPQGGLSLKCADCSFTDRKPSLPWGEGTGTTHDSFPEMDVAAPSCSIVPLDELNSTSSKERVNAKSATIGENTTRKFSIRDTCFMPAPGSSKEERDGNGDGPDDMIDEKPPTEVHLINKSIETEEGESLKKQKYSITSKDEENTSKYEENSLPDSPDQVWSNSINSHISILFCGDPSMEEEEVDPTNRVIGMEIEPTSEAETLNEHEDSDSPASSRGKEKNKKRSDSDISSPPRLDKLETTTENDLLMFNKERTFDLPANVVAPESGPAGKTSSLEEREVKESVGAKESNDDGRFLEHHSKGKGKALSNGDLSGLPSKDDNDSYESVESCNSAGRFSSGKRRWSFQQQLIVGSKRAKHSEDMHGSSSVVKNDSSFMKWISSMIKGVAKSNRDDEGLLALSLSNPDESCKESMNHSLPMDRKTQTLNGRNSGFNSIFRSIYCPNNTAQEASTALCSNLIRVTPMEIDTIGKRENSAELQAPKENLHESESRNIVGPLTLPQVSFGNFAVSLENRLPGPTENKNSGMLEGGHAKVTVQSLNASRIMLKTNPENEIPLAEEKKTNEDSHKGGEAIESSWISRFSSKASVSLLKLDSPDFHRNQVSVEVKKSSSQESPNVADNEQKGYAVDNEASTGFRQIENLHDKFLSNSMHEILPSQRVENSEAIASIFARRLDALKNIIPSHLIDGTSIDDTTCFFCGIKGHHLLNCSEISKSELEDLLKNVKSYDNAGASPRLCIRCFQLNHWASACPNTLHKEKAKASLPENVTRDRLNCSIKFEEVSIGHNLIANLDVKRYNSLSHGGNHSGEHLKKSSEKDLRLQITDVPEGIFAAVKLLQLSRVDILKWMNSKISLSQLDGLFLRLRLGKWEEGLGGTGYYVACITGMQKEKTLKNAKSPISVSIGGINYLVETKYISNQDFLEDELMTWWCTTSREGGKVLSEEDFKRKAEEKKRLGF